MNGSCPHCGGTDLADTMNGERICLDCEQTWSARPKKRGPRVPRTPSDGVIAAMIRDMGSRG